MKPRICSLAIAAAFALGCGDDDPSAPEIEVYRPQNSIENVLYNLIQAYGRQEIAAYEKLFADEFFFAFDPQDRLQNPDLPEEWDLTDELKSAGTMFAEPLVETITVDFVLGDLFAADAADSLRHPFPTGTMRTAVSEVELNVDTRDPEGGENIVLQVAGDQAIFFLYPHPTERVGGLPVWYIVEWRDRKIGSFAHHNGNSMTVAGLTLDSTWGQIKAHFSFDGLGSNPRR